MQLFWQAPVNTHAGFQGYFFQHSCLFSKHACTTRPPAPRTALRQPKPVYMQPSQARQQLTQAEKGRKSESRGQVADGGRARALFRPTRAYLPRVHVRSQLSSQGVSLCTGTGLFAKSLQSCPTLCNPMDGSPPGSPVPGILQARTLEWVAISFSNT